MNVSRCIGRSDVIYRTEEAKLRHRLEILRYNILGGPVLVGTTSVETERVSTRLRPNARRLALAIYCAMSGCASSTIQTISARS
jgi:preprotein translocase subunit SecA